MKKILVSALALCCLAMTAQTANASPSAPITEIFNWSLQPTAVYPGGDLSFSFDTTSKIVQGTATSAKLTLDFATTGSDTHAALTIADGILYGGMTFSGLNATYIDNSASLLNGVNDDGMLDVTVYAPNTMINSVNIPGYGSFNFTTNGTPFSVENATLEVTGAPVPVPAAAWLLGSGLIGLLGIKRKASDNS